MVGVQVGNYVASIPRIPPRGDESDMAALELGGVTN